MRRTGPVTIADQSRFHHLTVLKQSWQLQRGSALPIVLSPGSPESTRQHVGPVRRIIAEYYFMEIRSERERYD
jgi:hypothetical protein